LILDEAHYLKEPETKRTQAILDAGGIASTAGRVSFLTGTPAPNHAAELYPMLRAAGRFDGTYWEFARRACYVRETVHGPKAWGLKDRDFVRDLLAGWMLRRTSAVELPPTDFGEMLVEPAECGGEAILAPLARMEPHAAGLIAKAAEAGDFEAIDTPHMSTLRRLVGLAKVAPVAQAAEALLSGDPTAKLVLFALHRGVIEHLRDRLAGFGAITLTGGEPDVRRRAAKEQFQHDLATRLAVCQMKAAGVGLTLTAANHLWIVEPSWTPADNDQAMRRIVRIGQTRRTSVNFVTLNCSIDIAVNRVLRRKRNFIDQIVN
jgi:SWI/SNF-related matrix-associated actin-dependent regulator 1 of chromatin subfamily A